MHAFRSSMTIWFIIKNYYAREIKRYWWICQRLQFVHRRTRCGKSLTQRSCVHWQPPTHLSTLLPPPYVLASLSFPSAKLTSRILEIWMRTISVYFFVFHFSCVSFARFFPISSHCPQPHLRIFTLCLYYVAHFGLELA